MWSKLPAKDKCDLMRGYKKAGFSYSDMIKDYDDSYRKFEDGGELPIKTYNPSETVNQQPIIDPYLKAAQVNKSLRRPTHEVINNTSVIEQQKQKEKQDYINKYVREGHKKIVDFAPLKAVAYTTPIGMAVGAIQSAANIGPNIYNKEYGSATLDAIGMLPFASNYKEAYKLNPNRFKPDKGSYYRMLGEEGYKDAIETNLLRAKANGGKWDSKLGKVIYDGTPNYDKPYFSIGKPWDKDLVPGKPHMGYKGPYMAEVKHSDNLFSTNNTLNPSANIAIPNKDILMSNENLKLYKEHWWKGYKEVPKSDNKITKEMLNKEWLMKTNNSPYYQMSKQNKYLYTGGS